MTDPTPASGTAPAPADATLGALVHQLSHQVPDLIRSEIRLAQAEVAEKGKRAGVGIGMFSAAGLLAFFAFGAIVAAAIAGLATWLPVWASSLIVAAVLLLIAGVVAVLGKKQVGEVGPPKPERAIDGLKEDIATIKGEHS